MSRLLALLVALGAAVEGRAACDAPYDSGALLDDLVTIEVAVRTGDGSTARQVADAMEAGFACLSEPMPYMVVARAYRAVGAGKVLGGDEARGREWLLTAVQLDPGFEYGTEDLAPDSPARAALESQRDAAESAPVALQGRTFADGATYHLDGSILGAPRATLDRPHVFQAKTAGVVTSAIVQGNAFPESALVAPIAVALPEPTGRKPKPAPEPAPEGAIVAKPGRRYAPRDTPMVDQQGFTLPPRPAEKTPLIIAGAATVAAAGGLYAWAAVSRANFDDAQTLDEVDKYEGLTNGLVIASGAVLAVGASVLTWGIVIDDTGRPLPGLRLQF